MREVGAVSGNSFIAEEKFSSHEKEVVNDLSPTDSIPLGSFLNFCCSSKHLMSLCQIPLLFPGLLATLGMAETPVYCPLAGNLQGLYEGGEG